MSEIRQKSGGSAYLPAGDRDLDATSPRVDEAAGEGPAWGTSAVGRTGANPHPAGVRD
jgi:hypothetical protein